MVEDKQKSIQDILAACRKSDGAADDAAATPPAAADDKAGKAPTGPDRTPAPAQQPGNMSVSDILAAARAEKTAKASAQQSAPAAKATTAAPKSKTKTKTKTTAGEKAALQTPATKKSAGPMDTSSILAAARQTAKPGPMSKAEAASKGQAASPAKPARPTKAALPVPPMPAKPGYAQPKSKATPTRKGSAEQSARRGFFGTFLGAPLAVGFTTLTVTNLLWVLGLARFMFPNILTEPPSKFKVGFPGDFTPGTVTTKFKAQFGVWIVNAEYDGQLQLVALKSVCTHLGCTPNWLDAEQKFKCPCHGSGFYKDGVNFEGPAPRPLERYAVRIADDGQLEVDKSRTFQQEMGQWSDSASFVPV